MLASRKNIKINTKLLSIHNIIIMTIIFFRQVLNVSGCFALRKIFVTGYLTSYNLTTFSQNFSKIFLIGIIVVARHYQRELSNHPTTELFSSKAGSQNPANLKNLERFTYFYIFRLLLQIHVLILPMAIFMQINTEAANAWRSKK